MVDPLPSQFRKLFKTWNGVPVFHRMRRLWKRIGSNRLCGRMRGQDLRLLRHQLSTIGFQNITIKALAACEAEKRSAEQPSPENQKP